MLVQPPDGGVPDDRSKVSPEAALGGADAVEQSTYVSRPEPERPKGDGGAPSPSAPAGPNATWAIILFLAVGAVLVYLLGFGR